jgi:hypothetical protein
MVYSLVYIYYFKTDLETLDANFFTLCIIFILAGIIDYVREKNATLRHELTSYYRIIESQSAVITALARNLGTFRQDVVRAETLYMEAVAQHSATASHSNRHPNSSPSQQAPSKKLSQN